MAWFTRKTAIGVSAAAALATSSLIIPWEGLVLKSHWDPFAKIWDICYGETKGITAGMTKTPAECRSMLEKRVAGFETSVKSCLPGYDRLPLEVKASIISFSYNVGTGAACSSTLFRKLQSGDLPGACSEFRKWNKAGGQVVRGLTNRRAAETALCTKGITH